MAIPIKTRDEILRQLRTDIEGLGTNLNLADHSVPYDISLFPASVLGEELWLLADFVSRVRSTTDITTMIGDTDYKLQLMALFQYDRIDQVEDLISDLLDALVGNWNVTRNAARKARVPVRFYSSSNSAITVAHGARVSTRGQNQIVFKVLGGVTNGVPTYDSDRNLYYVELMCEAEIAGINGNVGAGTISIKVDNISGVIQVRNPIASFNGSDVESDLALATRAPSAWVAWSLDTVGGIEAFFEGQPIVDDAYVAKPGNSLVGRNPRGAPIDIFVSLDSDPVVNTDVFISSRAMPVTKREQVLLKDMFAQHQISINTNWELTYPPPTASTISYYPNIQPVLSVLSVSGVTSGVISFTEYLDTTHAFSGSTRSRSYIQMTIPGGATMNETISVQYTYDASIVALQNTIDSPENNLISQDLLVRAGKEVSVNITGETVVFQGYSISGVQATIVADLTKLLGSGKASTGKIYNRYRLGQQVDYSDLLTVALNVGGVDRIDTWIVEIHGTTFTSRYLLANSEYARIGTVTWL